MKFALGHIVFALLIFGVVPNSWCSGFVSTPSVDAPIGQKVTEIDHRIWAIYQANNGDLWFGSNGNGVYRFDGQAMIHYSPEDGITGLRVRDIQGDNDGNIFVSTNNGVCKFDGTSFTDLQVIKAASQKEGWALDKNDVWIVYQPGNHGPLRYDGEKLYELQLSKSPTEDLFRARNPQSNLSPTGVTSIYRDRRGHVWIGTAFAGLCRFDGQTLSWMHEEHLTTMPSGGNFGIRSIYEDRSGDFWICNTRSRFQISPDPVLADGFILVEYETETGLPDASLNADRNFNYYPSMVEDQGGVLWMACGGDGIWKYDGVRVTRYPLGDDAYAMKIYCDKLGKIWVGTLEQGLYRLNGDSFERFNAR